MRPALVALLALALAAPWAAGDAPITIEDETGETSRPTSLVPLLGAQYECRDARADIARTLVTVSDDEVRLRFVMADVAADVRCEGPLSERASWPRDHEEVAALLHGGADFPYVATSHVAGQTWAVCGATPDQIALLPSRAQATPDGWVLALPTRVATDACSFELEGALFVRAASSSRAHADWDLPLGPGLTVEFSDGFDDTQVR